MTLTLYAYLAGHDNDIEDLTTASPQPFCRMVQTPERRPAISRKVVTQGVSVVKWIFSVLTLEELDTIMSGLGLTFDEPSGEATIYTTVNTATDNVQDYGLFNVIAIAPEPGKTMQAESGAQNAWFDVEFTFEILEELEVA